MKSIAKKLLVIIFILSVSVFALASCEFDISDVLGEYFCIHEWSEWDVIEQGNCKTHGLIRRVCAVCGAVDEEITAKKEHIESDWIVHKEPSCIEEGEKHTECTLCGVFIQTEKIDEIGEHKYEDYNCVMCGVTSEECFDFVYIEDDESYMIFAKSNSTLPSEVVIPSSYDGMPVVSIGNYAFENCHSITSIIIPDSVISIGENAFYNCTSLINVMIPDSVSSIGNYTFYGCSSLSNIVIPNIVTYIGDYAFYGCSSISNIIIPNSVTYVGDYAFNYCSNLTSIVIPDSVTYLGYRAFYYCIKLNSAIIGSGVTCIYGYTFYNCTSLSKIVIPDSVTTIGNYAFQYCYAIADVYYTGTEEEWTKININSYGNSYLTRATFHYNYVPA